MTTKMKPRHRPIYRILFRNQENLYELYARKITQGNLFAFVEVEDILFGERSNVLVDPSEERLKTEFAGVKRTYIPLPKQSCALTRWKRKAPRRSSASAATRESVMLPEFSRPASGDVHVRPQAFCKIPKRKAAFSPHPRFAAGLGAALGAHLNKHPSLNLGVLGSGISMTPEATAGLYCFL